MCFWPIFQCLIPILDGVLGYTSFLSCIRFDWQWLKLCCRVRHHLVFDVIFWRLCLSFDHDIGKSSLERKALSSITWISKEVCFHLLVRCRLAMLYGFQFPTRQASGNVSVRYLAGATSLVKSTDGRNLISPHSSIWVVKKWFFWVSGHRTFQIEYMITIRVSLIRCNKSDQILIEHRLTHLVILRRILL